MKSDIEGGNSPDKLTVIAMMGLLMLVLVAIHTLCNLFVDYQGHMMGALMESDMRQELFDHYQKLSFSFYDNHRTGQLMSRITNDLFSLSEFYHHGPEDLIIALLKLIGMFFIAININVELTMMIMLFMPVMGVYAFHFNHKMNRALQLTRERVGDINAQVEDSLAGIRVVKSFANEAIERDKFAYENTRFIQTRRDDYLSSAYFYGGMIAFTQLMTIVIVNGSLDLLTFLLYVGILIEPIQRLVNFARLYQEGITGFNRFMDILEIEPDIQDSANRIELTQIEGNIEFRDVSFKYKGGYDYVLKNLSLEIKAGEYIALVGASGVGKTTLCSLILRFYDIDEGMILIDSEDIRAVSLCSLRSNIGLVHQDAYLFAGTIADNIGYGKPGASQEEIIAASTQAHAHDFIMTLPNGYDTNIGQRGVKLSGGQRQRLSIARVFLKNPPILIFDEATSALDNESEQAVKEALKTLSQNRTTLVIAHRLSTIRNADRILVLTDDGIHADLYKKRWKI